MQKIVLFTVFLGFLAFPGACLSNDLYIEIFVEERMLYLFEKNSSGEKGFLEKFKICSPKPGLPEYPLGMGFATRVEFEPFWYPTLATVEYMNKKAGKEIFRKGEAVSPGDPRNAMGDFKIHLSHSTPTKGAIYRIHGTNVPSSIGTRQSGGCIRMRNDEGLRLAKKVEEVLEKGNKVEVNILINKATSQGVASFFLNYILYFPHYFIRNRAVFVAYSWKPPSTDDANLAIHRI